MTTIGTLFFEVEDVRSQRAVLPYNLWMWQRPCDHFARMDAQTQDRAGALLEWIPGAVEALQAPIPRRVERRNNRLVLAQ